MRCNIVNLLFYLINILSCRMIEIAKSMGLTLSRPARGKSEEAGLQDEHRQASLLLPLVKYDQFMERRKRKKMR